MSQLSGATTRLWFDDFGGYPRRRLAPLLTSNDGGVWGEDPVGTDGTPVLRSTEISAAGQWHDLDGAAIRHILPTDERRSRLTAGDIVVTKASGSPDHIGKSALVNDEVASLCASFGNFMQRLRVDRAVIVPEFLHYFLMSGDARSQFNYFGTTSTGLLNLSASLLDDLRVPLPPLRTQRRIADFLDDQVTRIDQAIQLRKQQVDLLGVRNRSVLEEATLGVGPESRLKSVLREVDERVLTECDPADLLSVSIHKGVVPRHEISDDLPRANTLVGYKIVQAGDIVLNRMRAFQGGVGVAHVPGIVSPDYAVLRTLENNDPEYLHFLFRAPWFVGRMTAMLRGIGSVEQGNVRTPRVNVEDLLMAEVALPSIENQRALADRLIEATIALDGSLKALAISISLLQERKRSLITAAVTGEFDVSTAGTRAASVAVGGPTNPTAT